MYQTIAVATYVKLNDLLHGLIEDCCMSFIKMYWKQGCNGTKLLLKYLLNTICQTYKGYVRLTKSRVFKSILVFVSHSGCCAWSEP